MSVLVLALAVLVGGAGFGSVVAQAAQPSAADVIGPGAGS
jgi:hypothetical protein